MWKLKIFQLAYWFITFAKNLMLHLSILFWEKEFSTRRSLRIEAHSLLYNIFSSLFPNSFYFILIFNFFGTSKNQKVLSAVFLIFYFFVSLETDKSFFFSNFFCCYLLAIYIFVSHLINHWYFHYVHKISINILHAITCNNNNRLCVCCVM